MGVVVILLSLFILDFTNKDESDKHPVIKRIKDNFTKIDPVFSKIPIKSGDSAFTENKSVITLCLADPNNKKEYDMNTMMYVSLHELAHVITKSQGHTSEFKDNFSKLLRFGNKLGFYDPSKPMPTNYCGITSD